jgi:hypothetical protein
VKPEYHRPKTEHRNPTVIVWQSHWQPPLNVLREVYPTSYQSVLDAFYTSYVAGETQVDTIEAIRDKLVPMLDT